MNQYSPLRVLKYGIRHVSDKLLCTADTLSCVPIPSIELVTKIGDQCKSLV